MLVLKSQSYLALKLSWEVEEEAGEMQMQRFFNHKIFNYLVWTPLGSIVNL
jgi:hypothetical protein